MQASEDVEAESDEYVPALQTVQELDVLELITAE